MKIVNLLNRVLKSQGQELTKENEHMWWSPFVNHHKPKLQVNIKNGKCNCWVSLVKVDTTYFSYLKKSIKTKNNIKN